MRKLVEITFMSLDGVIDAPDITQEARQYFAGDPEHDRYQKDHLFAADTLLLGRATYEQLSKAYLGMAKSGGGAPTDFVTRMNEIPKLVASNTLKNATWNASIIHGDVAAQIRKIKEQPGKDIVKYGTGVLDQVLFGNQLIDMLCIIVYPFLLGHGTHLFAKVERTAHLRLLDVKRFANGSTVLEYAP
jgi:dihydrofolate reductase